MKQCTLCKVEKALSKFSRHRFSKDGYAHWCKECNARRAKIWRSTPSGIYSNIKGLNKFHNRRLVLISKENFVEWYNKEPKVCAYCDIPEELAWIMQEHYHVHTDKLTIDCMDNDANYESGNLVLSCMSCNRVKGNILTFKEMRYVGQNFVKPKWMKIASKCKE